MAVIPSNNLPALIGYYLGVACLIPLVGFALSLPAILCGVFGILKANSNPEAKGMGHAITAIILGIVGPSIWVILAFAMGMLGSM